MGTGLAGLSRRADSRPDTLSPVPASESVIRRSKVSHSQAALAQTERNTHAKDDEQDLSHWVRGTPPRRGDGGVLQNLRHYFPRSEAYPFDSGSAICSV